MLILYTSNMEKAISQTISMSGNIGASYAYYNALMSPVQSYLIQTNPRGYVKNTNSLRTHIYSHPILFSFVAHNY